MIPQTYLVMIRYGRLALAVAEALEERLSLDGHHALVLVPAARSLALAGGDRRDPAWQASQWPARQRPQVVAVYERGLLGRLEALGLAAYVGVPMTQDWRVIRWDNEAGAIMLPVASARHLVDAVADHTPWQEFAVGEPGPAPAARRNGRWKTIGRPAALGRKIAVAGAAGPLLLAGLPAAAAAAAVAAPLAGGPPGAVVLADSTSPAGSPWGPGRRGSGEPRESRRARSDLDAGGTGLQDP